MRFAILVLLAAASSLAGADRPLVFADKNLSISPPPGWVPYPINSPITLFALRKGVNVLLMSAQEAEVSPEDVEKSWIDELTLSVEIPEEIRHDRDDTAGERTIYASFPYIEQGVRRRALVISLCHQGFAYRLVSIFNSGDYDRFEREQRALIKSMVFLHDRPEWLARLVGVPRPIAVAGGLVRAELNQPRWRESTFDAEAQDHQSLDVADFVFVAGGAWAHIDVLRTASDAGAELESARHWWSTRLGKVTSAERSAEINGRQLAYLEISGQFQGQPHHVRIATLAADGVAVRASLESTDSRRLDTESDWEQMLGSLVLQSRSSPEADIAFTARVYEDETPANEDIAVVIAAAKPLIADGTDVIAFSPDGTTALCREGDDDFVLDLASHRRTAITLDPRPEPPVNWSADGKRLAYAAQKQVVVVTVAGGATDKHPLDAVDPALTGEGLIACRWNSHPEYLGSGLQLRSNRLVALAASGADSELAAYPLSRFSLPTPSPDGKTIAVIANRDYPRTAGDGGNLFVLTVADRALRRITTGPEDFASLAWSSDGTEIFATRRVDPGLKDAVGFGGETDLYRIDVATGAAVNLTRCGHIQRAWVIGADLAVQIGGWDIAQTQRGIFRIAAAELEQATASRPLHPASASRDRVKAVARAVVEAVGGDPRDCVPSAEAMPAIAEAFATVAARACGVRLDFTMASLRQLETTFSRLELAGSGRQPALALGAGAYYGETLRRCAGAQWRLGGVRFGDWVPAVPDYRTSRNALVVALAPFDDCYRSQMGSEDSPLLGPQSLPYLQGQQLLLVYPVFQVPSEVAAATDKDYASAWDLAREGKIEPALALLFAEIGRHPTDAALVEETSALAAAAGMDQAVQELDQRALAAGCTVPRVLERQADRLATSDATKAIELYRRVASQPYSAGSVLNKLGTCYAANGHADFAMCCWRQAHRRGTVEDRTEAARLAKASADALAEQAKREIAAKIPAPQPPAPRIVPSEPRTSPAAPAAPAPAMLGVEMEPVPVTVPVPEAPDDGRGGAIDRLQGAELPAKPHEPRVQPADPAPSVP